MRIGNIRWRWMLVDSTAWVVAALAAVQLRFEFEPAPVYISNYLAIGALAAACQMFFGWLTSLYRGRFRSGTFEDFRMTCLIVGGIVVGITLGVFLAPLPYLPLSVALSSGFLALGAMLGTRALVRGWRQRTGINPDAKRVILLGAGDAGEQLARSIRRDPHSEWEVVGFLDDSPQSQNLQLEGVRVLGTSRDIAKVSRATGAQVLIVSIAKIEARRLNEISEACNAAEIHMLVLPSISQLIDHSVNAADVREVDETDLLGRTVVDTDLGAITDMIHGRVVLITGAGGSIGSEIARAVHPYGPAKLLLLDRDESALHAVQLSIYGNGLLDSDHLLLADIRDAERVEEIFAAFRPDVVFHAAALKHLPLLENAPAEAVKTNIYGTANVLRAASRHDVGAFINISTDKAADPISVLGFSKRVTERLTASIDSDATGRYLSVRFGNVLGSRGSMLGTFRAQIDQGGPLTVTHPDVSRYFMTIPEAVQLVLQASVVGRSGEVLVLDMGEPVRIADVANRLVRQSGKRVEIVYTGLRNGEKLHEDLTATDELAERPFHELIMHVPVPPLPDGSWHCPDGLDAQGVTTWLAQTAVVGTAQASIVPAAPLAVEDDSKSPR